MRLSDRKRERIHTRIRRKVHRFNTQTNRTEKLAVGFGLGSVGCTTMIFLLVVGIIIASIVGGIFYNLHSEDIVIQVDDRERITSVEDSYYLIFTPDEEYKVSDTLWHRAFDSSRRYNKLDPGGTYRVRVVGYRIPFLSMYPNIVEVYGEVDPDEITDSE